MGTDLKILVPVESRPQLDNVRKFLDELDQESQRSLLSFIQGAQFMQSLMTSRTVVERSSA